MQDVLCVHAWGPKNDFGGHVPYRICRRCMEPWYDEMSEPEVIVARIR